uniref:Molybdopterin-binding n=1 Tax=Solanum tuberosum TaxID=4113 RepID=M1CQB1_SOLTU
MRKGYLRKGCRTLTSERVVVKHFETNGAINTKSPLDFNESIRQCHCRSSSATLVAVRMTTLRHLIYKREQTC